MWVKLFPFKPSSHLPSFGIPFERSSAVMEFVHRDRNSRQLRNGERWRAEEPPSSSTAHPQTNREKATSYCRLDQGVLEQKTLISFPAMAAFHVNVCNVGP
ncbi:hypothetical protein CEXT_399891 [Caerostris extrusa]|uniref:Uncharacterized protein n=1 Tax=Caerostris extrusa TaxID=172846 RepID=A0AAV4N8U2_CAEEX|nr:hypothetical protein CEXT_399891 [Caerostris extrusa]